MRKRLLSIALTMFMGSLAEAKDIRLQILTNKGVPKDAAETALKYYDTHRRAFENQDWISIIDYRKHSSERRYFLYNTKNNKVYGFQVAHGKGSDLRHEGYARRFSNTPNSKMTSLGFYKVSESYFGSKGLSVRLDGLSESNSQARRRAVVIHGASYVRNNGLKTGRSWGCPAVSKGIAPALIQRIKNGSLLLAFY